MVYFCEKFGEKTRGTFFSPNFGELLLENTDAALERCQLHNSFPSEMNYDSMVIQLLGAAAPHRVYVGSHTLLKM